MLSFSNAFICVCSALNMDQPFDMSIHHERVFITHSDVHVEYARGIETRVSDVDPILLLFLICASMPKILVLQMWLNFFTKFLRWNFIMACVQLKKMVMLVMC